MSDESVRLALRVHDEVSPLSGPGRTFRLTQESVTVVTCSVLTSVHADHISFSVSKRQSRKHRKVAVV